MQKIYIGKIFYTEKPYKRDKKTFREHVKGVKSTGLLTRFYCWLIKFSKTFGNRHDQTKTKTDTNGLPEFAPITTDREHDTDTNPYNYRNQPPENALNHFSLPAIGLEAV